LLFHTHFLSKNAAYVRQNVTVHYREKIETPEVSQLIVAKITAENKVL